MTPYTIVGAGLPHPYIRSVRFTKHCVGAIHELPLHWSFWRGVPIATLNNHFGANLFHVLKGL
jgi:hypothetical protein